MKVRNPTAVLVSAVPANRFLVAACGLVLLTFAARPSAQAATEDWVGWLSNDWNTKQNWNPQQTGAVLITDTATFGATVGNGSPNVSASTGVGEMLFKAGAASFTITGGGGAILTIGSLGGLGIVNNGASTQTVNAALALGAAQTWQAAGGNLAIGGTVSLGTSQTLTIDGASNTSLNGMVSGTGSSGLTKSGAGILTLSAANTYSGATAVNAGTLLLGASNVIGNASAVTLGGGTLSTGGFSDTLGALTLTADSTIDFGAGHASELNFTTLTLGSNNLNIWNWTTTNGFIPDSGAAGDGLRDRLLFTSLGSLSAGELSQIHFFSGAGSGALGDGRQISFGGNQELVPVPEPTTIFGALSLVGLVGYRERRRFRRMLAARL